MPEWIAVGIVSLYALVIIAVAGAPGHGGKGSSEFALGDGRRPVWVLVGTVTATLLAAMGPLVVVDRGFHAGWFLIVPSLAVPIGMVALARFAGPRMHRFADMLSLGEMLGSYYGATTRFLVGFASVGVCMAVLVAHLRVLDRFMSASLGVDQPLLPFAVAGAAVLAAGAGGMRALVKTPVLHVLAALVLVPTLCVLGVRAAGGISPAIASFHQVAAKDLGEFGWWPCVAAFAALALPVLDPAIMQRFLMARARRQAETVFGIGAVLAVPLVCALGILGMLTRVATPGASGVRGLVHILGHVAAGPAGSVLALGIVALLLAGIESYAHAAGVALVNDVLRPLWPGRTGLAPRDELTACRRAVWGLGALALGLQFAPAPAAILGELARYWHPIMLLPVLSCIFQWQMPPRTFAASVVITVVALRIWGYFYDDGALFVPYYIVLVGVIFNFLGALFTYSWESDPLTVTPLPELQPKIPPGILAYVPTPQNILRFCTRRVEVFGEQYTNFGAWALVNYMLPFFMWFDLESEHFDIILYLRIIGGATCFMMVVREKWLQHWHYYMPAVWYFALFFCLPFSGFYMFLATAGHLTWTINLALSLLMLSMLVDWVGFFVLLPLGASVAVGLFWLFGGDFAPLALLSTHDIQLAFYVNIYAVLIGGLLSRNADKLLRERDRAVERVSADMARDLRPQAAAITLRAKHAQRHMPALLAAYQKAREAGLDVENITGADLAALRELTETVQQDSNRILWLISALRMDRACYPPPMEHELQEMTVYSVTECVEEMLREYPFVSQDQRRRVSWRRSLDFPVRGDKKSIKQLLADLVTNGLHHTQSVPRPLVTIRLERDRVSNMVSICNNSPRMHGRIEDRIFDRYYSTTGRLGLGLTHSREVMHRHLGEIVCRPKKDGRTEFLLVFPKWKPDPKNWEHYLTEGIYQLSISSRSS